MPYKTNKTIETTEVRALNDNNYIRVDGIGSLKSGRYALELKMITSAGHVFYTVPMAGGCVEQLPDLGLAVGAVVQAEIGLPASGYVARRNKQGLYALYETGTKVPVTDWYESLPRLLAEHKNKPLALPCILKLWQHGELIYERSES